MVLPLINLGKAIGNGFDAMGVKLVNIGLWFQDVVNYLNPLSKDFFLLKAFVPADGFFDKYASDLKALVDAKFPIVNQIIDTFNSVKKAVEDRNGWSGVKINLNKFGVGTVTVIDPTAANAYGAKIKYWIGAFMYFMTALFVIRKLSNLLGAGK